jgi:hypothetical protein
MRSMAPWVLPYPTCRPGPGLADKAARLRSCRACLTDVVFHGDIGWLLVVGHAHVGEAG